MLKLITALALGLLLTGCGIGGGGASRAEKNQPAVAYPPLRVVEINVTVPRSLEVSEANRYYPGGDIVWREDPYGDRHAQVQAIVQDAMETGTAGMTGASAVTLDVEVLRFHALTQKARFTTGGVHSLTLAYVVRNAKTGEPLAPRRVFSSDLKAFGGEEAIAAMQRGETQKVRITAHMARAIREELTVPGGHKNAKLGIFQKINKF
ncbi:MAG: DUF6778 family protein [Sulfitobacter sp.]